MLLALAGILKQIAIGPVENISAVGDLVKALKKHKSAR
jgi:hypothetical protein